MSRPARRAARAGPARGGRVVRWIAAFHAHRRRTERARTSPPRSRCLPANGRATSAGYRPPGCSSATGGPAGCTCWGWRSSSRGRTSFWLILAMSVLILAVGWAYTQICRIYPDGGGVYTAAKQQEPHARGHRRAAALRRLHRHRRSARSMRSTTSACDAHVAAVTISEHRRDTGGHSTCRVEPSRFRLDSPGLWAIVAIVVIGVFNLMGPKHTGGFAIVAAVGMIFITLLITAFALPQVDWRELPQRIAHAARDRRRTCGCTSCRSCWRCRASKRSRNLTGVMKKPVAQTARKAIWVVAVEVAIFNVLLALVMVRDLRRSTATRTRRTCSRSSPALRRRVGRDGRCASSAGCCCCRRRNTAITDMISVQYLMARDGELPQFLQKLNRFGVPWMPAVVAASVPMPRAGHQPRPGAPGGALRDRRDRRGRDQRHARARSHPRLRRMRRKVADDAAGRVPAGDLGDAGVHEAARAGRSSAS